MSVTTNQLHEGNRIVKRVGATITGTTALDVWTPATGAKFRLKGVALRCSVSTALVGATPGDIIVLCDNTNLTGLLSLGVILTATDAAGKDFGFVYCDLGLGHISAAANNVLKVTTGATIGTGVILVVGFVWGDEV